MLILQDVCERAREEMKKGINAISAVKRKTGLVENFVYSSLVLSIGH